MSKYIAHTRRKIKPKRPPAEPTNAAAEEARERDFQARREARQVELERARADKEARLQARGIQKRHAILCADTTGRRRTAVRAAGIALISATAGLRTSGISITRLPGSAGRDLWSADVNFDVERGFTHYINDPATPANTDLIHAMRALAPLVAEELFAGSATPAADENNMRTAHSLVESHMRKARNITHLDDDKKRDLGLAIIEQLQGLVGERLRHLENELGRIVDVLVRKTTMSRSECEAVLGPVYRGFEDYYHDRPKPELFRLRGGR